VNTAAVMIRTKLNGKYPYSPNGKRKLDTAATLYAEAVAVIFASC
jgi:hypothetical protein